MDTAADDHRPGLSFLCGRLEKDKIWMLYADISIVNMEISCSIFLYPTVGYIYPIGHLYFLCPCQIGFLM